MCVMIILYGVSRCCYAAKRVDGEVLSEVLSEDMDGELKTYSDLAGI